MLRTDLYHTVFNKWELWESQETSASFSTSISRGLTRPFKKSWLWSCLVVQGTLFFRVTLTLIHSNFHAQLDHVNWQEQWLQRPGHGLIPKTSPLKIRNGVNNWVFLRASCHLVTAPSSDVCLAYRCWDSANSIVKDGGDRRKERMEEGLGHLDKKY